MDVTQAFITLWSGERLPCACDSDSLHEIKIRPLSGLPVEKNNKLMNWTSLNMQHTEKKELCQSWFGDVPLQYDMRCHRFHLLGPRDIRELIKMTAFQTQNSASLLGKHLHDAQPSGISHASKQKGQQVNWYPRRSGFLCVTTLARQVSNYLSAQFKRWRDNTVLITNVHFFHQGMRLDKLLAETYWEQTTKHLHNHE